MKTARLAMVSIAAAVLFGALAAAAPARNLSTSSQTLRSTFSAVNFRGVFGTTSCAVTLEGSLHTRTITKTVGSLIGYITRASLGTCSALTATILTATLPWHARYAGFEGTLPNILRLRTDILGFSFAIRETGGISCLLRSTATEPLRGEYELSGGTVTGETLSGSIRTGAECFGVALTFTSDRAPVTVLNSTTRITVRLI